MSGHPPPKEIVEALRAAGCVFAEEEAAVLAAATEEPSVLADMVARRVAGAPLEHVVGWAEVHGMRVAVGPGVFVPRRRTELLIDEAARLLQPGAVVVDMCCGCGAVGTVLASLVSGIHLHAADIDPVATEWARRNLAPFGGEVHLGDLYDALPANHRGGVDVIVANAPYVPTDAIRTLPREARLHEPLFTLDGGGDGLDVQRRVVAAAPLWLAPAGHLLVETSEQQAPHTLALFERAGMTAHLAHSDELDATVVIGEIGRVSPRGRR